jgi:hypothetical protein
MDIETFPASKNAKNAHRAIGNARPQGRVWLVFFHPDYDRRPRHPTGSADPSSPRVEAAKALAGSSKAMCADDLPPVGNRTPP